MEDGDDNGPSVFDQSVLTWQSLQEWAKKAWAKHYQQSPVGSTQNVKPIPVQSSIVDEVAMNAAPGCTSSREKSQTGQLQKTMTESETISTEPDVLDYHQRPPLSVVDIAVSVACAVSGVAPSREVGCDSAFTVTPADRSRKKRYVDSCKIAKDLLQRIF